MKRLSVFLVAVVVTLVVISPAQSFAGSTATVSTAKHLTKKHHKRKPAPAPAPEVLVPHVITVAGNIASICDRGYCAPQTETNTAVSFAECPAGYTIVSGGWEAFGSPPLYATVTQNHPVSTQWVVSMDVPTPFDLRVSRNEPPHLGQFRAVAQCQILLPA